MTTEQEKLILGQAQHLIASLMAYELLPKSLPDDKYRKLWEKVTQQLKLVHIEANRSLVAEREADRAAMREALEAMLHVTDCASRNEHGELVLLGSIYNPEHLDAAITDLRQRLEGTT